MRKIYVSDYTIKKFAEKSNAKLLFREKTEIADCVDSIGANALELPAIKNIKEDTLIFKTISSRVKNSAVCIPVGFTDESVAQAWNAVKEAKNPVLQVSLPVSTATMEYRYHLKAPKMLAKATDLVKKCREYCESVEFIAEDASRADRQFLCELIQAVKENGASAVTLCDDAGILLPDEVSELVKTVKNSSDIKVYVLLNDMLNMAVASAVCAITAGADGVKTAMSGDEVLNTSEFCKAVFTKSETLGVTTDLETTKLHSDIVRLNKKSVIKEAENEAHDGGILLDGDSTIGEVSEAIKSLGYELTDADNENVYRALMDVCEKKTSVGSKVLEAIIASSAMQVPSAYHLESFMCTSGNLSGSMANVVLKISGKLLNGVSAGDGPIDAAFKAIEQCMGYHYELDDFQIKSVTEGQEALGSALVKICFNGKFYSGCGLSRDIVGASIRAYLNAINKIVFEGEQN